MLNKNFITLSDMYIAYRKAKHEAFFDSFYPSSIVFTEFERKLKINLLRLRNELLNNESSWWKNKDFLGGHFYVPKSIDDSSWDKNTSMHYRSVDPSADWKQRFIENKRKKLEAQYRLIICATVEYQIISALWIIKVGHKFEERLNNKYCYGNRLRRIKSKDKPDKFIGGLNKDSLGLFSPYFTAYKAWRKNGLSSMKRLVEKGESVTAITMDLASFYHNVSAKFLLRPSFLNKIKLTLSDDEVNFTQNFIHSINIWYSQTPDFEDRKEGAIPVGLSASKIISNILLYELDQQVTEGIKPEYYGRYVDDIFLVFVTPENTLSGKSIFEHLSGKIDCLKISSNNGQLSFVIKLDYANDCKLEFTAKKQKIFSLSSKHGLDLINQISSQIRAQSSEYRMLPSLPRDSVQMAEKALLATSDASLTADALRKADTVSIKRLGLSLLLRDIESYSQDLERDEWAVVRKEFYGLIERYLLTPKGIFELFGYYSRVIQLMISNYDFDEVKSFISKLNECLELVRKTTSNSKVASAKFKLCKSYFVKSLSEIAVKASTCKNFDKWSDLTELLSVIATLSDNPLEFKSVSYVKELSYKILLSDLGTRPYKDYWYYSQRYDAHGISKPRESSIRKILRLPLIHQFRINASLYEPHWPALAFPTRPLNIQEIVLICPQVLTDKKLFKNSIMGLRGARVGNDSMIGYSNKNNDLYLDVPTQEKQKTHIALTNFETTLKTYEMVVKGEPDRTLQRYERVNNLINDILKSDCKSDYIVFPECSLPRRWAISIAGKLGRQGISLIAGMEYYKVGSNSAFRNDCLISLATKWPGYNSALLLAQPKINPSHEEFMYLRSSGGELYSPSSEFESPLIYNHGGYLFGVLICSDLTNPRNRFKFQGKIDTLFVLEWNSDVNTFSFLIEGAAHDIHTHIVQVNNRAYGDSRVRVPHRQSYKRDSVRLKGGIEDFFVIAEIDYLPLREYQLNGDMTDSESDYKPVPIGYEMSDMRK